MSLFGLAEKREIAELEELDIRRRRRIHQLEAALEAATGSREGSTRREADMADRIITLSQALKRTQRQLDDALGGGSLVDADLDAAGGREKTRRAAKAGEGA